MPISVLANWFRMTAPEFGQFAQGIGALVTAAAIVIGAVVYILRGRHYPRANLKQRITHHRIGGAANGGPQLLVRVGVEIENKGDVRIVLDQGFTRLQQILPLDPAIQEAVAQRKNLFVDRGEATTKVSWPLIDQRDYCPRAQCEIEPGEVHEMTFDFLVDADLEVVSVHTHLTNQKKKGRAVGWATTTTYNFR